MITDSFDCQTEPVVSLAACYGEQRHLCDVCIVTFSWLILDHVLDNFDCQQVAEIRAANGPTPIYTFPWEGKTVGIFLANIGATGAATNVMEANWLIGATKFILFGSAGALDQAATEGKYVVPTAAYRDEGMSYHYAPPADYIVLPGADRVGEIFTRLGVPYVQGKTWTTDAFYRETRGQMARRVSEGCLTVEMELAGVQAVCDFHGFSLYAFLATGDVLDGPQWTRGELHSANHSTDKFYLALEIVKRI